MVALVYLLAWAGLDWVAARYPVAPGVSLWYAPAALDVALLLVFGLRWAPALVVTEVVHATVIAPVGLAWWQVALLALVTLASYAGGAALLTHRLRIDVGLGSLRDVTWLLVVLAVAAPVPIAVAQVWLLHGAGAVTGRQLSSGVAGFWAGSTTAVTMLSPVLLVLARHWTRLAKPGGLPLDSPAPRGAGATRLERVGQVVLLAVVVWIAFSDGGGSLNYSYLVYAPLIWIGLRGGFVPAGWAVLAINVGAVSLNRGRVPDQGGFALQFGLVTVSVLGVLLGAAVTQRQADAETARRTALHDPLTGLANRTLLTDRLEHALARRTPADHAPAAAAVLFLDLDRFKEVNDSLGHAAGDAVLLAVADRLAVTVRAGDTAARLGGDEFAVLLENLSGPDEVAGTAQRILTAVNVPVDTPEGAVHVSASIGSASVGPSAGAPSSTTAEQALQHADLALHRAKTRGRNQHLSYDAAMSQQARTALDRQNALRRTLDAEAVDGGDPRHGRLEVVFQPIVAVPDRVVVGAEALARWTLPGGRQVPPADFIGIAEDTGLIIPLGRMVLRRACRAAAGWSAAPEAPRVAVNVSPLELRRADYADIVLATLAESGLPADRLELEVTETRWLSDAAAITPALTQLTGAGVRLVLDDFGTGYSSLTHLAEMPVTGIKIDRSFVSAAPTDPRSHQVVRAVLCIAAELDLEVTAEGVETEDHWRLLVDGGCTRAQGWLLGRPAAGPPGR